MGGGGQAKVVCSIDDTPGRRELEEHSLCIIPYITGKYQHLHLPMAASKLCTFQKKLKPGVVCTNVCTYIQFESTSKISAAHTHTCTCMYQAPSTSCRLEVTMSCMMLQDGVHWPTGTAPAE